MNRAAPLALALVVVTLGSCTFERRARDDDAGAGEEAPEGEAGARLALESFQAARRAGDAAAARLRLASEAVLLRNGRTVEWRDGGPAADSLLAPGPSLGEWRPHLDGRRLTEEEVLFVLRYGPAGDGDAVATETLLLAAGPEGWRIRLLHRSGSP